MFVPGLGHRVRRRPARHRRAARAASLKGRSGALRASSLARCARLVWARAADPPEPRLLCAVIATAVIATDISFLFHIIEHLFDLSTKSPGVSTGSPIWGLSARPFGFAARARVVLSLIAPLGAGCCGTRARRCGADLKALSPAPPAGGNSVPFPNLRPRFLPPPRGIPPAPPAPGCCGCAATQRLINALVGGT